MKKYFLIVFLSSILCFITLTNATNQRKCSAFCEEPDVSNFKACESYILKVRSSNLKQAHIDIIDDAKLFNKIITLIEANNDYAIKIGVGLLPLVDGAFAERLQIALGNVITRNPEIILQSFLDCTTKEKDINRVLLNLGDAFVDKLDKMQIEIEKRKSSIKGIKKEELSSIKRKCLSVLERKQEKIRRVQQNMKLDK